MALQADSTSTPTKDEKVREIRHEYTPSLPKLLADLKISLIISTYQAGKVVVVGVDAEARLSLAYHNFESAMGVAVSADKLAIGSKVRWTSRKTMLNGRLKGILLFRQTPVISRGHRILQERFRGTSWLGMGPNCGSSTRCFLAFARSIRVTVSIHAGNRRLSVRWQRRTGAT